MNKHQLKIWLATWGYTQKNLADELGLTEQTIGTYNRTGNYPKWFALALVGIEEKKKGKQQ